MAIIFLSNLSFPTPNSLIVLFWVFIHKPNRQNKTNMGIPVNEKCMFLRVGTEGHAYLDNVVCIVVIWKITAKREGEKREGS